MKRQNVGFTLIELLIVVAIIAILAAIAVPNFLEAQARAKVSSSKAGLRTLETALEAYAVDNNRYPYSETLTALPYLPPGGFPRLNLGGARCGGLTSPIAYLTSLPDDPFKHLFNGIPTIAPLYYEKAGFGFENGLETSTADSAVPTEAIGTRSLVGTGPDVEVTNESLTPSRFVCFSLGPDLVFGTPGGILSRYNLNNRYDPTNGTVSPGNVVRFAGGPLFP